ncbi:DUF397 domain-containing protein [Amycolatopsis anabasis]|uniref:DUF397 domain-containing protein n=1 Tax=Amycolatopsis anabasis TaxID=1840409 RepID=UPI00131EBEF5|nr:DUF397 domain-containing protein [Amycolatopsis anabasis]
MTDSGDRGTFAWRKSSYSSDTSNCVEVAFTGSTVGVRDSKDLDAGALFVSPNRWHEFLNAL